MKHNKFLILLFIFSVWIPSLLAQKHPQRSLYIEALGASNLIGIAYDARISPSSKWGYRVGIAYGYGNKSLFNYSPSVENEENYSILMGNNSTKGFAIPLEVNYLIGNNYKHNLEVGLGTSLGYYKDSYNYTVFSKKTEEQDSSFLNKKKDVSESNNIFGYFLYANIGYRYTSAKGFQLRVGISPSFNFGDSHSIEKKLLFPYLSLGYSF